MMKKSAIVALVFMACLALCAEETNARKLINAFESKAAMPPHHQWSLPSKEEVRKCDAAHAPEKTKPCVDELTKNAKSGKRGIEALGPVCCAHFNDVMDSCPTSSPFADRFPLFSHEIQMLKSHCPRV